MSTTPVTQEMIKAQHAAPLVSEEQKNAWVKLAGAKNALSADLAKRELVLQGLLINVKDEAVTIAMAAYKKGHDDLVVARMEFTNVIRERLIDSMMVVEKRTDPKTNAEYLALSQRDLALRKAATASHQLSQNIATEKSQFKAHFQNEYMALATAYRHALAQVAHDAYNACLYAKTPADNVGAAISTAELAMADIKPGSPAKFIRVHMSTEDGAAMYKTLQPPAWGEILAEGKIHLKEKFELYAHDLANAATAIEDNNRAFEATIVEEVRDMGSEQAANVLMASAEAFVMPDAGFKAVRALEKIMIEDNSEAWVVKIMGAFLSNFQTAFSKTRNKKYSSLTVAQMAAALDAAEIKVQGVTYQTVEK